jgi:hypothetical protein
MDPADTIGTSVHARLWADPLGPDPDPLGPLIDRASWRRDLPELSVTDPLAAIGELTCRAACRSALLPGRAGCRPRCARRR